MPPQFDSTVNILSIAATAAGFGYFVSLFMQARRRRPRFEPADVVFQEWNASGCSQKNILTKLSGARNCLRLVVTRNILWVTLWFPFSLFAPIYDLEHVIPLDAIMSVRRSHFLGRRTFLLSYRDSAGGTHTLRLIPRQPDEFIQRLGVKVDETQAYH